ncbi:phosphatidate cytidylyltransferase [Desulforhopalus sp. IMCC35007]|uniref:phosphatidate cytidylyltransferase n=1 Tax=Desulforhopalus sp. IMCC35007 TaxID=2569543 RepID=UPI0010AE455C|nr:phosphatidate cytidylyltransferase [Desulforhopalus sp. IMCC35007]TKB08805.1 phosphatidate cytidylyltransferase [Desulforhopalus sp. IMCC35007]
MKRIVPGLLIAGLWLLLLLVGSVSFFNLVIVAIVFIGADEYLRMAFSTFLSPLDRCILGLIVTFPSIVLCLQPAQGLLFPASLVSFSLAVSYFLYRYRRLDNSYSLLCRLVFGIFYVGVLGGHLLLLRVLPEGASWILIATAITASSDSGAYFAGKKFGKRKLCPNISPNKTVEGAIGGICCALLGSIGFAVLLLPAVNYFSLIIATVFLTCVGIAGDLTESIIKRGTGTKDSGNCLAGHGGILDRVDSLLFVAPVLYYFLIFSVV